MGELSPSKFIVVENFSIDCTPGTDCLIKQQNLINLNRVSHLNQGEETLISNLCLNYDNISFKEGERLELTNKIKHTIFTMTFGLKNAPSTFQRVMDNLLQKLQGKIRFVYLGDIIVFSTSLQEHGENLRKVFDNSENQISKFNSTNRSFSIKK